jgi:hypothetical protein
MNIVFLMSYSLSWIQRNDHTVNQLHAIAHNIIHILFPEYATMIFIL